MNRTRTTARRTGTATSPIHHGEILQGAFRVHGRIQRGLVTIPCELYWSTAAFTPEPGGEVTVLPEWRGKARQAAELTLRELEPLVGEGLGGTLSVCSDVPLGRGFGSSTSDVLAAIRAVADAFDVRLPRETVARLAVAAETASDSLMFDQSAVLFAHREGALIEDFGARLPAMHVLGFGTGLAVDTVGFLPARYTERELDCFDELRVRLRTAVRSGDVARIGEIATVSTRINQSHLPIPRLEQVCEAAAEAGAAGVHTAHSGDIAGLLFDLRDPDLSYRLKLAGKLLRDIDYEEQWGFDTEP
ncbi:hypothetical protein [Actinospica robiniae]|uniref:GHMP family kinase ATP-binding protein n=1 Tax=Actinospica robiniae TaxID=304901 RepID=UPI000402811C|nr:hypothetical protein [Actinospica robiniae]